MVSRALRVLATTVALACEMVFAAPGDIAPEVFMESALRPGTVYVGAEAQYVVRLFRRVPLAQVRMSWPHPIGEAEILALRGARAAVGKRHGHRYRITEWYFAVIPSLAGELRLPGVGIEATTGSGEQRRPVRVTGPAVTLKVRPSPEGAPRPWLPARRIELSQIWSASVDEIQAGDVLTRLITLRARGLRGADLPGIRMPPLPGLTLFHDQPVVKTTRTRAGIHGMRQQRIVLIADAPGVTDIPAVELNWWDVGRDRPARVTLPAKTLRAKRTSPVSSASSAPSVGSDTPAYHSVLTLLFVTSIIALLGRWWSRRDPRRLRMRMARRQLVAACRANTPATARLAMLDWASAAWPEKQSLALHWIPSRLSIPGLAGALAELDAALYGKSAGEWSGRAMARCARSLRPPPADVAATSLMSPLRGVHADYSNASSASTRRSTSAMVL